MDVVQRFNDELQALFDNPPPVSKDRMYKITRAALKGVKFYKHIVLSVEKLIARCTPDYKVPGLYVIDSIIRQSRHTYGPDRDCFAPRFSKNIRMTFSDLFNGCLNDDRPKIVRVLNLWQKNRIYESEIIQPLLDLANPNSSLTLPSESSISTDSPANLESVKQAQTSKYLAHHHSNSSSSHNKKHISSSKHHKNNPDGGLRFSKNMLDFDYDEDDDDGDETPTEAEPPLSSTLNKIEMEHRSRNELPNVSGHQSSQATHLQHIQSQQSNLPNQINSSKGETDPVLERWNRLIKQQSITSENPVEHTSTESRQRQRSRSPVVREKHTAPTKSQTSRSTVKSPKSVESSAERKAERSRKCFPDIRDKHLTVCSSTLWLGHVPKTVSEADISDAFGEYGTITSIDLIPPRGCAYVCMDRRQDAKKALSESRNLKLNGSHIKMAWAPGKGFKEYKKLKDFWEVDTGSSFIPYAKIDSSIDFEVLEDGGVIDEDSMSMEMREIRERRLREKEEAAKGVAPGLSLPLPTLPILSQPPPFTIAPPNLNIPPPTALGQAPGLGGIPFPPPNVVANQMPPQMFDQRDPLEQEGSERLHSPNSIEKQLSMTERQINMVEQQLNMIQQAQGINQSQTNLAHNMHHQAMFHQGQPHPMLFDLGPRQLLHGSQMMDPGQIPIFPNAPHLMSQPQMLQMNQVNVDPNMNGNPLAQFNGRYR